MKSTTQKHKVYYTQLYMHIVVYCAKLQRILQSTSMYHKQITMLQWLHASEHMQYVTLVNVVMTNT